MSAVLSSGKASISATAGDQALRWSSPTEYYPRKPNQVVDRILEAPMQFVLDNFNSTKLENCVLAPGDSGTQVHPMIAVGLVRKSALGMVETVTDVEWSPTKITHKARTSLVGAPPCCFISGYGFENSVEDMGNNKTRLINKSHQETKWCSPLALCCLCFCWNSLTNSLLQSEASKIEKKFAASKGKGSGICQDTE